MQFRRMRGPSRPTLGLCLTLLLAGCAAVGPDYVPPKLSDAGVPGQWTSGSDMAGSDKAVANTSPAFQWWAELDDPLLNQMVTEGFRTSPTLDIAVARVSQARAAYAGTRAAELPAITGDAESERSASDSSGKPSTDSWLSTNASWEIDLFGAVRRGNEGAAARAAAQQATLADVRVSLAADITDAYLSFRACQSNVALSEQDVVSREATEKLTAASVTEGFTAPYQAIRSKASVAEAKTQLASTRAYCARQENLLTRLAGIPRTELTMQLAGKPTGLDRLPVPRHFGVAIPAQSLTQRPDIRAAERMGRLHDALHASGYDGHPLQVLLVRLLFCLFADDTGIFQPAQAFRAFIEERTATDGSDLGARLAQVFQVLNTPDGAGGTGNTARLINASTIESRYGTQ